MSAPSFTCNRSGPRSGVFACGRVVLGRDPTTAEACPSYGGVGLFICADCVADVGDFLEAAYNARARRMEHRAGP